MRKFNHSLHKNRNPKKKLVKKKKEKRKVKKGKNYKNPSK
jgi:hypothetical protein